MCYNCPLEFTCRVALNKHLKSDFIHLPIDDVSNIMDNIKQHFTIEFTSAMKGCYNKYPFKPKDHITNEQQCLDYLSQDLISILKFYNKSHILLKWSYTMDVQFHRPNHATGDDEFKNAAFSCEHQAHDNMDADQLADQITQMRNDIIQRIDKYSKEGSGWILCKINSFKLDLFRFRIKVGGKMVHLPAELTSKHCVINLDSGSSSDNCFKWAVLCALHHKKFDTHRDRIKNYRQWENEFDFQALL